MKIRFDDDLDLIKTAESGQCFRWKKINREGNPIAYRIIAGSRVLFIERTGDKEIDLSCGRKDYDGYWRQYLDADTGYREIRDSVKKDEDLFLYNAVKAGKGIRILNQDPFEMLISFIISQRKNIPAIRSSIERLSLLAGEKIELSAEEKEWLEEHACLSGAEEGLYGFPLPEALSELSPDELLSCGTGYRAPYIRDAALKVRTGTLDLEAMKGMGDEELFSELMKIYGVGKKVASCICLFGFHRLDFFPVDVWIERVLNKYYPEGFPYEAHAPYNGIMQQYMFFYGRQSVAT